MSEDYRKFYCIVLKTLKNCPNNQQRFTALVLSILSHVRSTERHTICVLPPSRFYDCLVPCHYFSETRDDKRCYTQSRRCNDSFVFGRARAHMQWCCVTTMLVWGQPSRHPHLALNACRIFMKQKWTWTEAFVPDRVFQVSSQERHRIFSTYA